jgi:hypothetical protein
VVLQQSILSPGVLLIRNLLISVLMWCLASILVFTVSHFVPEVITRSMPKPPFLPENSITQTEFSSLVTIKPIRKLPARLATRCPVTRQYAANRPKLSSRTGFAWEIVTFKCAGEAVPVRILEVSLSHKGAPSSVAAFIRTSHRISMATALETSEPNRTRRDRCRSQEWLSKAGAG